MEVTNLTNWKDSFPREGDIYFWKNDEDGLKEYNRARPVIILRIFHSSQRVLVAPVSSNFYEKLNKDWILITKIEVQSLSKDSVIKLSFIKTCDIKDLKIHIGSLTNSILAKIYDKLGFYDNIKSEVDVAEERPKIMICGPHGNGRGIEKIQALANKITSQGKYEGFVLVDMPEISHLTLKRKFQAHALLSRGVIVYFSDECSGACNEFDWASELDIFTVGIVNNHLPTEMLNGIDATKENVKLIRQEVDAPFSCLDEAIDWIDRKIEDRINRLDECYSMI